MSVVKSQRGIADMEFLSTARQLEIFSLRKCKNAIPKGYTFFLAQPIALSAKAVYSYVKKGNSIYPTNQHEVQLRRDFFLNAYAELQDLVSQIEVAKEICNLNSDVMQEWSRLIFTEITLVKGVLEKDKQRYRNLN